MADSTELTIAIKAKNDASKALKDVKGDAVKLGEGLDDVGKRSKEAKAELDDLGEKSGSSIRDGMNKAAAGLAVVSGALTIYSKNALDFTTETVQSAKMLGRQIGTTTEEASRLTAALGRMGIDASEASSAFGIFSKKIVASSEATEETRLEQEQLKLSIEKTKKELQLTTDEIAKHGDKTGELALKVKDLNLKLETENQKLNDTGDAFQKIGVSTKDAQGVQKDFNTILFEVADKFKAMPDGIDKTALSMDLFGRKGKDLLPVLNLGSAGIKDLEDQAEKLGLTLTTETVGAIGELVKSQKEMKASSDALKIAVGTATAPVLTKFNETVNDVVMALLNAPEPIKQATVGVLAFGGPIAGAAASALGFAANLATVAPQAMAVASSVGTASLALAAFVGPTLINTKATTDAVNESFAKQSQALNQLGFDTSQLKAGVDPLKLSEDFLKQSTDMLANAQNNAKDAANRLNDANLNLTGANLRVEQAQLNYTEAVKRFGPDSLQARQAQYDLNVALTNQKTAADNAKKANEDKAKADAEAAKKQELKNATEEANKKLQEQEGLLDRIGNKVKNLGKSAGNKVTDAGNGFMRLLPGFAGGVENFSGGVALVGEKGPELVNLPKGSDVIPATQTRKVLTDSKQTQVGGNGAMINITNHYNITQEYDLDRASRDMGYQVARVSN